MDELGEDELMRNDAAGKYQRYPSREAQVSTDYRWRKGTDDINPLSATQTEETVEEWIHQLRWVRNP